jgi:hypothetical protein
MGFPSEGKTEHLLELPWPPVLALYGSDTGQFKERANPGHDTCSLIYGFALTQDAGT